MKTAHKGAYHELIACTWLYNKGYEVFRNEAPTGPVDIIAMNPKTGETVLIDVKTVSKYTRVDGGTTRYYSSKISEQQTAMGVRILFMDEGKVLGFHDNKEMLDIT